MKFKLLKESFNKGQWEEVKSKSIYDSDGFMTDYTWYKGEDENGDQFHIFMFGDKDIYDPDRGYADYEVEIDPANPDRAFEVAQEWFDSYKGFDEEEKETFEEDLQKDTSNSKTNAPIEESLSDWSMEDEMAERKTIDDMAYWDVRKDSLDKEDIEKEVRKFSKEWDVSDGSFPYGDKFVIEFDLNNIWVVDISKNKKYPTELTQWEFQLEEDLQKEESVKTESFDDYEVGEEEDIEEFDLNYPAKDSEEEVEVDDKFTFGDLDESAMRSFTPDNSIIENFIQNNTIMNVDGKPQNNKVEGSNEISSIADPSVQHDDVCDIRLD